LNSTHKGSTAFVFRIFLSTAFLSASILLPFDVMAQVERTLPGSEAILANVSDSAASLPDAPSTVLRGSVDTSEGGGSQDAGASVARIHTKFIPAGWTAQPLAAHDKVILGLKSSVMPLCFLGIVVSAGYSHARNGQPNFGTDSGAFGQRLGVTAIRDTSEAIFSASVYDPLLHEDPRYYVEGPQYGFFHRVVYSVTRPLITRTDSGKTTINAANLLGNASGSAISYTYYPKINQNFHDTAATFGGSLGGDALEYLVSEFSDEVLVKLHMKKQQ
jgi:hypothetical protein